MYKTCQAAGSYMVVLLESFYIWIGENRVWWTAYIKKDTETKAPLPDSKLSIHCLTDSYAPFPSLKMRKNPSFLLLGRRMWRNAIITY